MFVLYTNICLYIHMYTYIYIYIHMYIYRVDTKQVDKSREALHLSRLSAGGRALGIRAPSRRGLQRSAVGGLCMMQELGPEA